MKLLAALTDWRAYCDEQRSSGRHLVLVPTMGALHAGHEALFRHARAVGDVVLATSFVNPRQFEDPSDIARYPRTPDSDRELARAGGVDCFVEPTLNEMWPGYPETTATTVCLGGLSEVFEGAGRPGHFDGVASVVAKILVVTGPCRAVFGEKDFQQLCVVRRLVVDLGFDVEVDGVEVQRDEDGLALSSRNVRLSGEGRARALGLSRALAAASSPRPASAQRAVLTSTMERYGIDVAYADVVDPETLRPCGDEETGERRALVAGFVEGVRLLDNAVVSVVGVSTCS